MAKRTGHNPNPPRRKPCIDCGRMVPEDRATQEAELWGWTINRDWRCGACQDRLTEESAQRMADSLSRALGLEKP
jgi:hypothetical protein